MAIVLPELLDEKQVILRLRSRKLPNALREIIQLLAQNGKICDAQKFLDQVLAREQAQPSAVENGVAFPHARTDLVDEIVVGMRKGDAIFHCTWLCLLTCQDLVEKFLCVANLSILRQQLNDLAQRVRQFSRSQPQDHLFFI